MSTVKMAAKFEMISPSIEAMSDCSSNNEAEIVVDEQRRRRRALIIDKPSHTER